MVSSCLQTDAIWQYTLKNIRPWKGLIKEHCPKPALHKNTHYSWPGAWALVFSCIHHFNTCILKLYTFTIMLTMYSIKHSKKAYKTDTNTENVEW